MPGKTTHLQIRIAPRDKTRLRRLASAAGMDLSSYLLARALPDEADRFAALTAELRTAEAPAFVFAELSTVLPRVGGQYAFFREAFHPLAAFLHGWSLLFIIQSGATAGVAVAFAKGTS